MQQFGKRIDLRIPAFHEEYQHLFQNVTEPKDPHKTRKMWKKLEEDLCGECYNWCWECVCPQFPKMFNMLKPFLDGKDFIKTSFGPITLNEMYSILHYFPAIAKEDIDEIYPKYRRIRRICKLKQNRKIRKEKKHKV